MREVIAEFETPCKDVPDAYGDAAAGCQGSMAARWSYGTNATQTIPTIRFICSPASRNWALRYSSNVFPASEPKPDWRKRVAFYEEQRSDFQLPVGQKFDTSNLAPAASGFVQHEAFRTRDGRTRRRVVHAFVGAKRNILLIYSLDTNNLLSSPFFGFFRKVGVWHGDVT